MTRCDKPQGSFLFRLDLPTDLGTPFRTSVEYQRVAKRTMERTGDPPVPVGDPPTGTAKRAAPPAWRNELRHTLRFMPGRARPCQVVRGRRSASTVRLRLWLQPKPCSAGTFDNSPQF